MILLAAVSQVAALIQISSCHIFSRRRRLPTLSNSRGPICFPRYWWLEKTKGLPKRLAILTLIFLLRMLILVLCIIAVFMRFDIGFGQSVQNNVRMLGETILNATRDASRTFIGLSVPHEELAYFPGKLFDEVMGVCPSVQLQCCGS